MLQIPAMRSTPKSRWFTIYTKPRAEIITSEALARRGYTALLPMYQERYWEVDVGPVRPLFPRYLFVDAPKGVNWFPLMSIPGVSTLLCFGQDRPAVVPLSVINELVQRLEADDGVIIIRSEPRRLKRGQRCLITAGPLVGYSGLFVDSTEVRVRLMMDILGRSSLTDVPSGAVIALKPERQAAA